jgi:hypothetical protein
MLMRFGRRDHESFIGSYDPEHEMPDPDRGPRDRWQSDVYRHNAADGRWGYRWNPERVEERGLRRPYRGNLDREIQPRDRYEQRFGGHHPEHERFAGGWDRDFDRERQWGRDYGRDRFDRDRFRDDWSLDPWERDERTRGGRY